jgi:hypothetical protein
MNQDVVHARSVRAVQVLCRLRTSRLHREFLRRVVRKSPRHLGDSSGAPEDLRRDVPSPHSSPESHSHIPTAHRRNTACTPDRYRENSATRLGGVVPWRTGRTVSPTARGDCSLDTTQSQRLVEGNRRRCGARTRRSARRASRESRLPGIQAVERHRVNDLVQLLLVRVRHDRRRSRRQAPDDGRRTSWSAPTPGASVCSRAAVAARAGSSSEPAARSATDGMNIASWPWQSKGRADCESTTVRRAAAISKPMTARGTKVSCSPTGRHSISTSSLAIVDSNGGRHRFTTFKRGLRRSSRDADHAGQTGRGSRGSYNTVHTGRDPTTGRAALPMPLAGRPAGDATGLRSTRVSSRASPTRSGSLSSCQ